MSDTLSPEERLFKVIQQGKLVASQGGSGSEKRPKGWLDKLKSVLAFQSTGKTGTDSKESFLSRIRWPEVEPETINKVLGMVLVVVLGLAIYAASGKSKDVATIVNAAAKIKVSSEEGKKKSEPLKALSFYLSQIRKRDIFRANSMAPAVENTPKSVEALTKITEGLKLQGISWGDIPKAMIFAQNGKSGKMYFLVEGQAIGTTGLKVSSISKSTVTVSDGKEEAVLL